MQDPLCEATDGSEKLLLKKEKPLKWSHFCLVLRCGSSFTFVFLYEQVQYNLLTNSSFEFVIRSKLLKKAHNRS